VPRNSAKHVSESERQQRRGVPNGVTACEVAQELLAHRTVEIRSIRVLHDGHSQLWLTSDYSIHKIGAVRHFVVRTMVLLATMGMPDSPAPVRDAPDRSTDWVTRKEAEEAEEAEKAEKAGGGERQAALLASADADAAVGSGFMASTALAAL